MNAKTIGDINVGVAWINEEISSIKAEINLRAEVQQTSGKLLTLGIRGVLSGIISLRDVYRFVILLPIRSRKMKTELLVRYERNYPNIAASFESIQQMYPDADETERLAQKINLYQQHIEKLRKS